MDPNVVGFLAFQLVGIGMLLSGFVGMTLWKDKGGSPSGGFIVGLLLGILGVFILALATPGQKEIDRVARSHAR